MLGVNPTANEALCCDVDKSVGERPQVNKRLLFLTWFMIAGVCIHSRFFIISSGIALKNILGEWERRGGEFVRDREENFEIPKGRGEKKSFLSIVNNSVGELVSTIREAMGNKIIVTTK